MVGARCSDTELAEPDIGRVPDEGPGSRDRHGPWWLCEAGLNVAFRRRGFGRNGINPPRSMPYIERFSGLGGEAGYLPIELIVVPTPTMMSIMSTP